MTDTARPPSTRAGLLDAAEGLILERGLAGLSMREVGRRAGAGNVLAVQYWFGGKDGLVQAILDRHHEALEDHRERLLADFESVGDPPADGAGQQLASASEELRLLTEILVLPYAAKLDDGPAGGAYLRLMSDVLHQPHPAVQLWPVDDPRTTLSRWRAEVTRRQDPRAEPLHRKLRTARFLWHELANRAVAPNRTRDDLFVSDLVDIATVMLFCPVSTPTLGLLKKGRSRGTLRD